MTQEEKDLLINDLCARLPYGVKIVIQDTFKYSIVSREYHVLDVSNFSDIFCFNYKKFDKHMKKAMRERPNDIVIKPYLFPLSSMTEEQKRELEEITDFRHNHNTLELVEWTETHATLEFWLEEVPQYKVIQVFDWLRKNHFDFQYLIEKGLAIDATGLKIY